MRQTGLQICRFKSAAIKCANTNISVHIICSALITIKKNYMYMLIKFFLYGQRTQCIEPFSECKIKCRSTSSGMSETHFFKILMNLCDVQVYWKA